VSFYIIRAFFLDLQGCEVFEDLSALCWWGVVNVPW
jgi:hypothetical protein